MGADSSAKRGKSVRPAGHCTHAPCRDVSPVLCRCGLLFFLARKSLGSAALVLFGCVMLVLSPRILAHSFYNSRDIPNLSFFVFGITSLLWYLDRRTKTRAIVHGMVCALAMSLRATGVFLPLITIMFLAYQLLLERRDYAIRWYRETIIFLLFLAAWVGMTFLLWPLLWSNPLGNFYEALITTSHFRDIPPWYYVPRWIVISTPFLYTCFFLFGTGVLIRNLTNAVRTRSLIIQRDSLVFWSWLLVPIISIIITRSSIYDDWRHVFFLYPAFVLIALEGVQFLWTTITQRHYWLAGACVVCWTVGSLTMTTIWILQYHPLEAVYFSIPSAWVDPKIFGLDYWGLSYRQGFEWVLAHDNRLVLRIHPTSSSGYTTIKVLTPQQFARLRITEEKDADYILDNFGRDHFDKIYSTQYAEVHTILVDGVPVLSIYDRSKPLTDL